MSSGKSVFILAHPDDEALFWPLIARVPAGDLALAYMTDGSAGGKFAPDTRAVETKRMLSSQGIDPRAASFLGQDYDLSDGVLHQKFDRAWSALWAWVSQQGKVESIFSHAWEGGHQDHDVCHVLALTLAEKVGAERVAQVACYRRPDRGPAPYSVWDPIKANGRVDQIAMTGAEKRVMASCLVRYPSQWRSWVGLGPPLLTKMAISPFLPVQAAAPARVTERPHDGRLLYEARGGPSFEEIGSAVRNFRGKQ